MDTIEKISETIDVGVITKSINIPLRVRMSALTEDAFDFNTSIDEEGGQIVLTPVDKDTQFEQAHTADTIDDDRPILEQPEVNSNFDNKFIKEFSIDLTTSMLGESENDKVSADIDDIGQCILSPMAVENSFIAVSVNNDLNLITEDIECVDYFGYKLCNNGDGWDIKSPTDELIEEGVATQAEAKIIVLRTELAILEDVTKPVDESIEEEEETVELEPEVEAEVIEEAVTSFEPKVEYSSEEILATLINITDNFTEEQGIIRCDTLTERAECIKILQNHYSEVTSEHKDDLFFVSYSNSKETLVEETDEDRLNIINRFMQGNLPIFSDTESSPLPTYIEFPELASNGYVYYYDPETDSMVTYLA